MKQSENVDKTCKVDFEENCKAFSDSRPLVPIRENKRTYLARNPDRKTICHYKIDGCLIKDGIRCDDLLLVPGDQKSLFIELKGKDLLHAVDQIDRSISLLGASLNQFQIHARIILSKTNTPDLRNTRLIKLRKKLVQSGGNLIYRSRSFEENI